MKCVLSPPFSFFGYKNTLFPLLALAIGLGGIVALVDNEILGAVVLLAGEVAGEDGLCAVGVAALGVERGARHVRDHGVAAAKGVLGGAQGVVLGRGLGEPDVASVAGEVARLEGGGDVFLDDDGAAGGVDEVRACWGVLAACLHPVVSVPCQ